MHKTCALAAQTFMLAMSNEGYDTCPMEGFDSRRVKKDSQFTFWCRSEHDCFMWNKEMKKEFGAIE